MDHWTVSREYCIVAKELFDLAKRHQPIVKRPVHQGEKDKGGPDNLIPFGFWFYGFFERVSVL
jgi:hypothetical protein